MPELHVIDHPLVAHKLTQMRRKETSSERFRQLLTETSLLLTYEVTRELALHDVLITTPLVDTHQPELVEDPVVVSILRAGNGLLDGVLQVLPSARVGHVGLYRDHETLEAVEYYCKFPPLEGRNAIVVDPMLATGNSAVHAIDVLNQRGVEDGILPACRELGIGFVPYSPLGRGFLTGDFNSLDDLPADDWRRQDPRWSEENFAANMGIVDTIRAVAQRNGVSPAQAALAWLIAQGDHIVPIPGVKRIATMSDSVAAADLELSQADLEDLAAAVPPGAAQGDRYSERGMRMVRI